MLVLILLTGFGSALRAQVSTGTLSGYVTDPTGAVVVGAEVTAVNVGTNLSASGQSNQSGLFTIPNLLAGTYAVAVTHPGFTRLIVSKVTMDVVA